MHRFNYARRSGIIVDSCAAHGLWFDAGELNKLRTREAAAALDIGDIKTGKEQNKIEQYRCPRCGGPMRIIAFILEREAIERILRHIGEETEPPAVSPARGPPQQGEWFGA